MVIRELVVRVIGAPMAGGPSTPDLVAAVGDAGGLGFLAGGYRTASELARQIAEVWDQTSRPFGVNLFVPESASVYAAGLPALSAADRAAAVSSYRDSLAGEAARLAVELPDPQPGDTDDWERKVDLVIRERVPIVSFTFGLPQHAVFAELDRAGVETLQTVTDAEEARAALDAGATGLVVQGPDGGGHRGTLHEAKVPGTVPLLDLVREIRALTDRPIVAAGGVSNREAAAAAREAGADAVQIGTALLLTPEAGTGLAYRRALQAGDATETVLTRAFSGRWGRALRNDFIDAHDADAPAAYPEVHHVTTALRRAGAAAEDPSVLALWAGVGWRSSRPVPTATIVASFAD